MNSDQYSLSNLWDIVVPEPVSWWPVAPAVWVVLGLATVGALVFVWRLYVARKRNAYRRAGLALLAEAKSTHDVSVILKRVALAAFPREQVASLAGDDWVAFLNQTCTQCDFTDLYATEENVLNREELIGVSTVWVKHHLQTLNT
jgi:hypothetical protein